MSMPTKGKQQHHLAHHHHHHQQQHHNPHQQHPLVVNVNVNNPGVHHLSQGYSTVVATSTPRYISNAGPKFARHDVNFIPYIYIHRLQIFLMMSYEVMNLLK
uniref:Uncharacterized protein n=1 Tax=Vespula pensylvanica TaxID=30213 RepID=A0A834PBU8_VESPE|nr:hypothetical protein H0235_003383 [Vespula pensylvanica]